MATMMHPALCVGGFYFQDPPLCLGKFRLSLALTSPSQTQNPSTPWFGVPTPPPDVVVDLVILYKPTGRTNNSDLDMAGIVLHHKGTENCFDVQERTALSRNDNRTTMWWKCKVYATSTSDHVGCILQRNSIYSSTFLSYPVKLCFPMSPENRKLTKSKPKGMCLYQV